MKEKKTSPQETGSFVLHWFQILQTQFSKNFGEWIQRISLVVFFYLKKDWIGQIAESQSYVDICCAETNLSDRM